MQSSCWSHNTFRGISTSALAKWNLFSCSDFYLFLLTDRRVEHFQIYCYIHLFNLFSKLWFFLFLRKTWKASQDSWTNRFWGCLWRCLWASDWVQPTRWCRTSDWPEQLKTASLMCALYLQIRPWGRSKGQLWVKFSRLNFTTAAGSSLVATFLGFYFSFLTLKDASHFLQLCKNTKPHFLPHFTSKWIWGNFEIISESESLDRVNS